MALIIIIFVLLWSCKRGEIIAKSPPYQVSSAIGMPHPSVRTAENVFAVHPIHHEYVGMPHPSVRLAEMSSQSTQSVMKTLACRIRPLEGLNCLRSRPDPPWERWIAASVG